MWGSSYCNFFSHITLKRSERTYCCSYITRHSCTQWEYQVSFLTNAKSVAKRAEEAAYWIDIGNFNCVMWTISYLSMWHSCTVKVKWFKLKNMLGLKLYIKIYHELFFVIGTLNKWTFSVNNVAATCLFICLCSVHRHYEEMIGFIYQQPSERA